MALQAQQRLTDLGFWPGPIDGVWGGSSRHAAIAFQKYNGLSVNGELDQTLLNSLESASRPEAREPTRNGLEIDRGTQVALLVVDGSVRWAFDISTGTSSTPTPGGDFTVVRQIDGIRVAPLGTLYRPKYFYHGFAVHGYTSVPSYPASHGCVRVTYAAMDLLWAEGHLPIGARITVY